MSKSEEWKTILNHNGWSPFFKTGPELDKFLTQHEQKLKSTMKGLNIIEE